MSLARYVERLKPGQERIYFLIAESIEAARASPYIERLKERGIEVLLLADRIDEWIMGQVEDFDGKRFKDAARGDLELGALADEADKQDADARSRRARGLLKRVKDALGRAGARGASEHAPHRVAGCTGPRRARPAHHHAPRARRGRPEGAGFQTRAGAQRDASDRDVPRSRANAEQFAQLAELLYDQASLAEGGQLANPAEYVQRLNRLLIRLAGVQ